MVARTTAVALFLIWATIITFSTCYVIHTVTVDSSTKPFVSRIVLTKEFLKYTGEHSSPSFIFPTSSGIEWRFRFERGHYENARINIELELLSLPKHVSHVIISVNCIIETNPNATNAIVTTTENLFLSLTRKEFVKLAIFWAVSDITEVSLDCRVEGLLSVTDIKTKNVDPVEQNADPRRRNDDCLAKLDSFRSMSASLPPSLASSLSTYVSLKAHGYEFPVHRFNLRQLAPSLIPVIPTISGHYQFDFGDEIDAFELRDLVHFMNFGNVTKPTQTYPKLIAIAAKYKIDCLDGYCAEKGVKKL